MDALKIQNCELSHCLTSMKNNLEKCEHDAKRYRSQTKELHPPNHSETIEH
jgi:hypothetical protein